MKRGMQVMSLVMVLGLCGCMVSREPDAPTLSSDTVAIQPATQSAVLPTETITEPIAETQLVDILVITEPDIVISESVPKYDPNIAEATVTFGEENSYFSSIHVQLPTPTSGDQKRYGDGVFWFCTDDQEMRKGNHYDTYYLEDGVLKRLNNVSFCREYTLLGENVILELSYTVHNGKVLLTYVPVEQQGNNYAHVVDSSRGPKECLVEFILCRDGKKQIRYFALVDLETGELTDFLSEFDSKIFENLVFQFVCWDEENNFIAQQYGSEKIYYFDVAGLRLIENYAYDAEMECPFEITAYYEDGRCYRIYDPAEDETVLLCLPGMWDGQWYPMDGNRKLVMCKRIGSICQLLIFDADTNMLIRIKRENANSSDVRESVSDQELVISSHDGTVFSFYCFNKP